MAKRAKSSASEVTLKEIEQVIHVIRGQRVILDFDLARFYGVTTRRLNEQVRRNIDRFPDDFAFQLSQQEFTDLMSQSATSNAGRGGRRKKPWAFTEHGVAMLSSVLRSPHRCVGVQALACAQQPKGWTPAFPKSKACEHAAFGFEITDCDVKASPRPAIFAGAARAAAGFAEIC